MWKESHAVQQKDAFMALSGAATCHEERETEEESQQEANPASSTVSGSIISGY